MKVNLSGYDNRGYDPGAGLSRRFLWYCVNALVFHSWLFPMSRFKRRILLIFGAKVGQGAVLKPRVNIKYPWNLRAGDNVWFGVLDMCLSFWL